VKARFSFDIADAARLTDSLKLQGVFALVDAVQKQLTPLMVMRHIEHGLEGGGTISIDVRGDWRESSTARDAIQKTRETITRAMKEPQLLKVVPRRVQVEVTEETSEESPVSGDAGTKLVNKDVLVMSRSVPEKDGNSKDGDRALAVGQAMEKVERFRQTYRVGGDRPSAGSSGEVTNDGDPLAQAKGKVRPMPKLNLVLSADKKTFDEFTAIDVPLQKVLDSLGQLSQTSYVYHRKVAWEPVFVSLRGVTPDQALAAIADATGLKLERRSSYVTFVP